MKQTRLFTLLLASLALSTAAFAADAATVFSVKGQVRVKKDAGYSLIAVGNGITDGSLVQVGAKSSLGVKLVDGGTAYFGPNSSFRIKFKADSGPGSTDAAVTTGTVAGNFTNSSFTVTTPAGVAELSGTISSVSFAPAQTGAGALSVACSSGTASVTTTGSTTSAPVAAGQQLSVAPSTTGTPTAPVTSTLSAAQVETVTSATTGSTSALTAMTNVVTQTIATGSSSVATIPTPAEIPSSTPTIAGPSGPAPAPAPVIPNLAIADSKSTDPVPVPVPVPEPAPVPPAVLSPNGEGQQP
jgi:hypothetical protein